MNNHWIIVSDFSNNRLVVYDINYFQFQRFIGGHDSKIVFWGYVVMKIIYYVYVIMKNIVLLLFNFSMEHLFINGDEKVLNKANSIDQILFATEKVYWQCQILTTIVYKCLHYVDNVFLRLESVGMAAQANLNVQWELQLIIKDFLW